ncbi:MAG TPA: recombinase [Deltaproteobacteria bacterium]|nr:recombinase [Deltaproteobacteria bacterium]
MSNKQLALVKKDTVDVVAERVREFQENGQLHLPPNYSPENAMKSAWLKLQNTYTKDQKPVLQACARDSIANSLLDMVVQGLNPSKNQCYFVAYGNQLVCMRSYFGSMAVVKNVAGAKDVDAQAIYEGDEFDYEINHGRIKILKHKQSFSNRVKGNIIGAYAVISFKDERPDYVVIMTLDQIKQAWKQGRVYKEGGNSTHTKFTEEMCKKTVINRACKSYINSSSDSNLLLKHFNRSDEERIEHEVQQEINENANSETIDIDYEEVEEEGPKLQPEPEPQEEPEPEPKPSNYKEQKKSQQQQLAMEGPGF